MTNNGKLTPETTKTICDKIQQGITAKEASITSGITEQTFYNWIQKGKEAKSGKYFEFFESIKKAEAELKASYEKIVKDAGEKTWTAAAWYLERKYPDEYGKKADYKLEHTGKLTLDLVKQWINEP